MKDLRASHTGMDKETKEKLKTQYGDVWIMTAPLESQIIEIAVKKPSRAAYDQYRQNLFDEDRRRFAFLNLLMECVVYPDRSQMDSILDELPGLPETFGPECAKLAGNTRAVEVKKL